MEQQETIQKIMVEDLIKDLDLKDYEYELYEYDSYICDAISEIADGQVSIYYADIIKFISDNVEEVADAIDELGWDGVGRDLYKAGQYAEQFKIEREFNMEGAISYAIYQHLLDNNITEITEEQQEEIDIIISRVDNNDTIDNIYSEVDDLFEVEGEEDED